MCPEMSGGVGARSRTEPSLNRLLKVAKQTHELGRKREVRMEALLESGMQRKEPRGWVKR